MIYNSGLKSKWHRNPKKRTLLEKIARRFTFPKYNDMALTWDAWDKRNERLKRNFPVRWFINETIPDLWRDYVMSPARKVRQFFRYRFKERLHIIELDLKPGYYDPDTRLIHGAFQMLVDYVEIQLAAMHHAAEEAEKSPGEPRKRYDLRIRRMKRKHGRDPEAGLAYLDWQINESQLPGVPMLGGITQSEYAKEKKFLYEWWTVYRKQRANLHNDPLIWDHNDYDPKVSIFSQNTRYQHHLMHQLEVFYEDEDTEMLHRLINIRSRMWV
jgi:hypothetical protein